VRTLAVESAAAASNRASRPQKAEDFQFGLSKDFKVPQGVEFELNEQDPLVGQYRQFALESGLNQAQFTKGLDLVAAMRLGEAQQFAAARTAELGKLGATANDRITSVVQWLTAMAGDKAAGIVKMFQLAPRADTVEAMETIIQKFVTQGSANFSAGGRVPPADNGKIPGYDKMTFEQRRFEQDKRRAAAR